MPYVYVSKLLVWPVSCNTETVTGECSVTAGPGENCFIVLESGRAEFTYEQDTIPFGMEEIAVVGREITVSVAAKGTYPCRMTVLRMKEVSSPPYLDLNQLCMQAPTIDAFFGHKPRFCILQDTENIRLTFNALSRELSKHDHEWEMMISIRFQELIIQLARSYYNHSRISGIRLVSAAREYIRVHYQEDLTVQKIATYVGISRSYLAQLFSTYLHYSTVDYIQAVRCSHAAYLLRTTNFTTLEIALESGFNSRQHFARTFEKIYGMTLKQYRKTRSTEPEGSFPVSVSEEEGGKGT